MSISPDYRRLLIINGSLLVCGALLLGFAYLVDSPDHKLNDEAVKVFVLLLAFLFATVLINGGYAVKMLFKKKFALTLCYVMAALLWWPLFHFLLEGFGRLGSKIGG